MVTAEEGDYPRLFGTNGIRGIPDVELTADFCSRMGRSIGKHFSSDTVVMGRDTRSTGDFVFSSVVSGILASGTSVIDLGILPTPAVQYYCKTKGLFGVVITASHNPPQFNGIKCIDKDGTELDRSEEEKIEKIYHKGDFSKSRWQDIGVITARNDAISLYHDAILNQVEADRIRERGLRVLVDTGNGASYFSTPGLMEKLGCKLVTLNSNPDGRFSSRDSEPKPENLGNLLALMKSGEFDVGIAHDGDADRAVFIDENGNFIDGDKTLSLVVSSVVAEGDRVVTPISSSNALDEICREKGATLVRTKVGAPLVSRAMISEKAKIGGEENGGVIYGKHQYCRDGAMTAALVLNLMAVRGKKVSELISELPDYTIVKKQAKLEMSWPELLEKLASHEAVGKADFTDGIKIIRDDGWILVRPSGTEPIIRIYAQSKSKEVASDYCGEFVKIINGLQGHT